MLVWPPDYRHRQAINVINRKTIGVSLLFLRIESDQPIQIMSLGFARIACERITVNAYSPGQYQYCGRVSSSGNFGMFGL
jgi:hypothetical protein